MAEVKPEQESAGQSSTSNNPSVTLKVSKCDDCERSFTGSYLLTHFDYEVCNNCWDPKDKHSLITRTQAKTDYLLKDCDLDLRQPSLKFIAKKNPNPMARGDMRLYLQIQVEERALEVWESEEKLLAARDQRASKRTERKKKEFDKKMKSLRKTVRSSVFTRNISSHIHEYGEERYLEDSDSYQKTCKICNHVLSYEKM